MAEVQADGNVRFVNPLSEGGDGDLDPTADASETPPPGSVDARTADFKHELTDDELGDLTFAFQALDSDSSGTIEPLELHAMVSVLAGPGTVVALDSVKELFKETKDEFRAWMKQQHEDATLPPWMDPDEAARQGVHGETHTGVERHHAELNIEKGNKDHAVWGRVKRFGQHPLIKPLSSGIDATNRILQMSYGLAKDVTTDLFFDEDSEAVGEQSAAAKELKNLIFSPDHLVFAEYVHMMCSHALLERFVTDKDWHKRSSHMRKFRQAFDTADVNGDNNLEFDELEMVMTALDHEHDLSHEDMLYLWDIMIQGEPELKKSSTSMNFTQYLHGLSNAQEDEKANAWLNFEARNKFELLSLLIDTPVSHAEEEKLLADLTGLEKMGIAMLKKDREELEKEHTKAVLKRAGNGTLRKLTPEQVKNMNSLKIQLTALSGFIGFLWTIGPCLVENHVCAKYGVNGIKNTYFTCDQLSYLDVQDINGTVGYRMNATHSLEDLVLKTCQITQNLGHWTGDTYLGEVWPTRYVEGPESQCMPGASWDPDASIAERCMSCECMSCGCIPHDDGEIAFDAEHPLVMWWLWVGIAIGINVVFEIGMLMFYAVRYCVRVSRALDQRLVPLNADRAFVADSLVRAAFELGNPVSPVMGVDPGAEPKSKFKILLLVVAYKAKVVLTGQVIKFVIGKLTPPYFSLWAKPWCGTMGATILWDALVASCIMLQAQIRGFGVYTNCEVFNDILEHHFSDTENISDEGKLQMVRAVGVAIVKNGSMYPTMELLLRHSIQYLHLRGKTAVSAPGILDNEGLLLKGMSMDGGLTDEERRVAMSIYVLACILDGDMGEGQMQLWAHMCEAASDIAVFDKERVLWLTTRYRAFEMLTGEDVHDLFDPDGKGHAVPGAAKRAYFCFQFQNVLTC